MSLHRLECDSLYRGDRFRGRPRPDQRSGEPVARRSSSWAVAVLSARNETLIRKGAEELLLRTLRSRRASARLAFVTAGARGWAGITDGTAEAGNHPPAGDRPQVRGWWRGPRASTLLDQVCSNGTKVRERGATSALKQRNARSGLRHLKGGPGLGSELLDRSFLAASVGYFAQLGPACDGRRKPVGTTIELSLCGWLAGRT
jgi:hypothetical protein